MEEVPGRRPRSDAPTQPAKPGEAPLGAPGPQLPGGSGPRRPRRVAWGWIIFGLVLLGLVLYAIIPHGGGDQAGAGQGRGGRGAGGGFGGAAISVNTAKVGRQDVPIYLDALGTVTPLATVTVRPQIGGQITKIAFEEGQMVKAGQLLVQIDPRPWQAALNNAEAVVARDQANLQNSQVLLERDQTLLKQDSIARQDVDNQEATVRQLQATIKSDQAAVESARLNVDYTHITAPVSGRVGLRQVDLGNYVTAGQGANTNTTGTTSNGLVVITAIAPIDVLFTLPEDNLPQVSARLRSGATLTATAYDRAQTTQLAQGKLLTLDNLVDTTTGTVKAKARFTNADGALFPSQFVNVKVLVDTQKNDVVVPSSAVLRGSAGLIVYVVNANHTVSVRNVVPGAVSGQITAIVSGLQVGETVVTDGTDRLREGAKVILPGECPPTGGGRKGGGRKGGGRKGGQKAPQAGQAGGQANGQGGAQQGCRPGQGATANGQTNAMGAGGFGGTAQNGGPQSAASTATQPAPQGDRQPGGNPAANAGGGARQGGGRLFDQLNLSADQKSKIDAIMQEARQKTQGLTDQDARRQAMQGANQRAEALLTPDQKTKYEQLRAQRAQSGGGFGGGQGGNAGQN